MLAGETLTIIVGQQGTMATPANYCGAMGGGGSFIVRGDEVLLVAGGGGGAGKDGGHVGGDASLTEAGTGNSDGTSQGGANGDGGTAVGSPGGCSGAGYAGDGSAASNYCDLAPVSFTHGGTGGGYSEGSSSGGQGGFGGGGAGHTTCEVGGGGGYSGGGAGCSHGCGGGGGGSFNAGANQQSSYARNPLGTANGEQTGSVSITCAGPPPVELCDDGVANSDDASCRNDCTRSCPRPPAVADMTISMTAGLAPGSVATYHCANVDGPVGDPLICHPDGTWSGAPPTGCSSHPACLQTWDSDENNADGQAFTLCLLPAQAFDDGQGAQDRYVAVCAAANTHPVGCGTSYHCNRDWPNGDCVQMPDSWGCNMLSGVFTHTGFATSLVTFQEDGTGATLYAATNVGGTEQPAGGQYSPVCGWYR